MSKYSDPIITKTAILFDLHEPIYGSCFGIWDKWLKIAKERNLNMVVNTPFGTATYKYTTWMKGAKKKERYYKNPDVPMVFYSRDVLPDIKERDERKKLEEKEKEKLETNKETLTQHAKRMLEIRTKLKDKLGV